PGPTRPHTGHPPRPRGATTPPPRYRLSAAAKAMIETLVELDQAQHAAA
ncbi:hypothetical protein I5J37_27145, partial [Pseudomonas aeruginosa]|nr:hypothetical protein [Pseudomonas aeruginosa]